MVTKTALTIAGSDPYSGGGLQTDLLSFQQFGFFGISATTSIATFNQQQFLIEALDPKLLERQLASLADINFDVIKIGLLATVENIAIVKTFLVNHSKAAIVLDPILAFKEGHFDLDANYLSALINEILPNSDLITPNLSEARLLTDAENDLDNDRDLQAAAKKITSFGIENVVIKGQSNDLLLTDNQFHRLVTEKLLDTKTINGAGDAFSAALACNLGLGKEMLEATQIAKSFATKAIENGVFLKQKFGSVWPTNDD